MQYTDCQLQARAPGSKRPAPNPHIFIPLFFSLSRSVNNDKSLSARSLAGCVVSKGGHDEEFQSIQGGHDEEFQSLRRILAESGSGGHCCDVWNHSVE